MRRAAVLVAAALIAVAGCTEGEAPPANSSPDASGVSDPDAVDSSPTTPPPGTPSPSLSPTPNPSPSASATSRRRAFDAGRALAVAQQLASLGPRPAGSPADVEARAIVAAALEDAGWQVHEQPFSLPQGGESANVVATVGPTLDRPHVVVGAHLDTVAGSPGANDNGSGIGVVVAVAEALADEAAGLPVPVVLVAFGAEEYQPSQPRQHHIGSEVMAGDPTTDVIAMLSVDMVGHGDTLCICWFSQGPNTLAERLRVIADLRDVAQVQVRTVPDWSDHGPFARRGIPAALLWTGDDGRLHTPQDTAEHLRRRDVERAGELTLAFVRSLSGADRNGLE